MTELISSSLFYQLAAIVIVAGCLGLAAFGLRQPLLVAFIATGILVGPDMLGFIQSSDTTIETLAQLGITLLLFMVGLKLDLSLIRKLGSAAVITGLCQVTLTALCGFLLCLALGFDTNIALLFGIALSFSSTIIVVKMLSDKRAIDSLYGRLSLGVLIIQDIVVILVTIILSSISADQTMALDIIGFAPIFIKLCGLLVVTGLFIRFAAMPLSGVLARSPELMVVFAIGFAAMAAALSSHIGLSKELGGLMAGVALASTPLRTVLAARLTSLRDFMLLFFFISLGTHISMDGLAQQIIPALILSLFVMLGKPLIILIIINMMGYRRRTGFLTGLTLGQISEFSLILIAMAHAGGIALDAHVNLITLTGLMTIALSTYAITYNSRIYNFLETHTALLGRRRETYEEDKANEVLAKEQYDVLIFGLGRYGTAMAHALQQQGKHVLGIDFDPEAVKHAQNINIPAIYGDAADPEFPGHLPLDHTKVIIFAFHHYITGPLLSDLRHTLAHALRDQGYRGHIAATSHHPAHDHDLKQRGIDIILEPFKDAALRGADDILSTTFPKS